MDFDSILGRLPSLKKLIETYGTMSLSEYAKKHYIIQDSSDPLFLERKKEFLDFLSGYITEKFGTHYAHEIVSALEKNYAVSTAEHHGPMGHSFFFQSTLLRALTQSIPVVTFATSHVSLGNSSYPRGFVFHGDGERAPREYIHIPFFSAKYRTLPVSFFPAYTREDIEQHAFKKLLEYKKQKFTSEILYSKWVDFLETYILSMDLLNCQTYSEQVTRLNHRFWSTLFPDSPPSYSLDAEDIVVQLLLQHLTQETMMTQMLTDVILQPSLEVLFDGISCCFNKKEQTGTYLFWYLDEHHRRYALWREGDELVSQDGVFRIKMEQKEYIYHLKNHHVIPSGLLIYTMFVCYYGITCFGGFAQGEYLPKIQHAFQELDKNQTLLSTQCSILNEDMAFILQKDGDISTAMDIYFGSQGKDVSQSILSTSLQESLYRMGDEIGRCF